MAFEQIRIGEVVYKGGRYYEYTVVSWSYDQDKKTNC